MFGKPKQHAHVKDAFHHYTTRVVHEAVNSLPYGTKAAAVYYRELQPGEEWEVRLRLCREPVEDPCGAGHAEVFHNREAEAEQYYTELAPVLSGEEAGIFRRARAGLLWCKKFCFYSVIDPKSRI